MEAAEALWTRIASTVLADTGTGGLLNTGFTGYLRAGSPDCIMREGDPAAVSITAWPYIIVRLQTRDISPLPASTVHRAHDCMVELVVEGDRDQNADYTVLNRTLGRCDTLFNDKTMSTLTDTDDGSLTWSFSPITPTEPSQFPDTGKLLRRALRFRLTATRT